jgi:4-hydroxyphenylacetate 3-monooxygenase
MMKEWGMLRSGEAYLAALRDGRRIRLGNEIVTDVTTHKAFRNTARSFARLYDLKRAEAQRDAMAYRTEDGQGDNWSSAWFRLPRNRAELEHRAEAHRRLAEWSYGLLGRSMDHVPSFVAGMAMMPELFDANRPGFGANLLAYLDHLRRGDLFACYLVLTPQGSRNPELWKQAGRRNPALQVVGEYDGGIIVSGQKMLGTSAVFSDEAWIGSMIPLGPDQVDEAVTFAIPINQPGVELWVRSSFELAARNRVDDYFASQFDETDAVMVFNEVRVPWERVFSYRDVPLMRDMYFKTPAHVMGNHQSNWRFTEKLKLIIGIAHKAAEMAGVLNVPAIQQILGRLAASEASLLGLLSGQIDQHEVLASGHVYVNRRFLYATLQWCAHNYYEVAEEVRSLLGAGPFALPADIGVLDDPEARAIFDANWGAPGAPAEERYRFVRMAWDLLGSDFAGRHQQYERFYGGPPHIMDLYSYFNCPWSERRATVDAILDDMRGSGPTRLAAE